MFRDKDDSFWPQFELITYSNITGISPNVAQKMMTLGVPKTVLGRYKAANKLTVMEVANYGELVCFGTRGFTSLCLASFTGEVVNIIDVSEEPPSLVNSSLEQFINSVRAVYERFPFDSWNNSEDTFDIFDRLLSEWDVAASELTKTLRNIDPVILDIDGFWTTFLDDLRMGSFSTEDVLHNASLT